MAGVSVTPVGAPGRVYGVRVAEGAEATPVPAAFVAVALKVYEAPFVKPVT